MKKFFKLALFSSLVLSVFQGSLCAQGSNQGSTQIYATIEKFGEETILLIKDYAAKPQKLGNVLKVSNVYDEISSDEKSQSDIQWGFDAIFERMEDEDIQAVTLAKIELSENIFPKNCAFWFSSFSNLKKIEGLENLKTDNALSMSSMFYGCTSLETIDLSSFKTNNVNDMSYMFADCSSLKKLDLTSFSTESVTSMYSMFSNCSSLEELDLKAFDTKKVLSMGTMFYGCSSLKNVDISSFETSNVVDMSYMFYGCGNMQDIDLENFSTESAKDMGRMFSLCSSLENLDVSGFRTENAKDMAGMFSGCSSLEELDLSSFSTDNVTAMNAMFSGCSSLENLNISSFNTQKVTAMDAMFYGCKSLDELNLDNFNTQNVKNMSNMFAFCESLESLDLAGFDTKNVSDMSGMFKNSTSLKEVNLENFNTEKVKDMTSMFSKCESLEELNLSSFNTKNVTSFVTMFNDCSSLKNLDLSSFATDSAETMSHMFYRCESLESLDVSSFNTSNVRDMNTMFYGLKSLKNLDLRNFNTENVEDMANMFCESSALVGLDLSSFNTEKVKDMDWMFKNCTSLENLDLSSFNTKNVEEMAEMFVGATKLKNVVVDKEIFKVHSSGSGTGANAGTGSGSNTGSGSTEGGSTDEPSQDEPSSSQQGSTQGGGSQGGSTDGNTQGGSQNKPFQDQEIEFLPYKETVVEKEIGILPPKVIYEEGEELDLEGGYISKKVVLENGDTVDIKLQSLEGLEDSVKGFRPTEYGKQEIVINIGGEEYSFEIEVVGKLENVNLLSETLKTEFLRGKELDFSEAKVVREYTSAYKDTISLLEFSYEVVGYNKNELGSQEIEIKYIVNEKSFSQMLTIELVRGELESINLLSLPEKLSYIRGEDLSLSGGSIFLAYADGSLDTISMLEEGFEVVGYNKNELGSQEIEIKYAVGDKFFSQTLTIELIRGELKSAILLSLPTKLQYKKGEELDLSGGSIFLAYADGSGDTIFMLDADFELFGYDKDMLGVQDIEIKGVIDGKEYSCIFQVEVLGEPTKIENTLDASAIEAWVNNKELFIKSSLTGLLEIYSTTGSCIKQHKIAQNSAVSINLEQIGTYVLKMGKETKKIIVR